MQLLPSATRLEWRSCGLHVAGKEILSPNISKPGNALNRKQGNNTSSFINARAVTHLRLRGSGWDQVISLQMQQRNKET